MVIPTDGLIYYALGGIEQIGCSTPNTRVERRTLRKDQFAPRDNVIERKTLREQHSSAETPPPLSLRDVSPTGSTAPLQ